MSYLLTHFTSSSPPKCRWSSWTITGLLLLTLLRVEPIVCFTVDAQLIGGQVSLTTAINVYPPNDDNITVLDNRTSQPTTTELSLSETPNRTTTVQATDRTNATEMTISESESVENETATTTEWFTSTNNWTTDSRIFTPSTTTVSNETEGERKKEPKVKRPPPGIVHESDGAIAGIVVGALLFLALSTAIALYVYYVHRNKEKKRPSSVASGTTLYPTDTCSYLDDSIRVSYINSHIELPKETTEEMLSLDNDSFLNSLEAMTIPNYWADNAKNTKV